MVVAEVFAAQRGAAAAVAVDEEVAAAVAFGWLVRGLGCGFDDLHGVSPLYLSPKVFKRKGLSPDFGTGLLG